ncbi:MAG TPA: YafY family protein [Candidatus Eremiobacteraceae bacterium]
MKSDRLLAMLLLLQARGRLAARAVARELEVSERTVYRDVDSLSAAGVPVFSERGSRGGIVLAAGYRAALTNLGDQEVRALFISASNPIADLGLGGSLARSLEILAGALPETKRRSAERARGRIYIDAKRWVQAEQPREHLASLQRAIWQDLRVELHYRDRAGKVTRRMIEPLGLVAKAGIWYLVAQSGAEMRVFRAERIIDVRVTDERFAWPADFNLEQFWRDWSAALADRTPKYPVKLLLHVNSARVREALEWFEARFDADGSVAHVSYPGPEIALGDVLAHGGRVEVLEPAELRAKVMACAREVTERYASP